MKYLTWFNQFKRCYHIEKEIETKEKVGHEKKEIREIQQKEKEGDAKRKAWEKKNQTLKESLYYQHCDITSRSPPEKNGTDISAFFATL